MKAFRKLFNNPDKEESLTIEQDCKKMEGMADELSKIEYVKEEKSINYLNSYCSHCNKKTDIVNKIARVEGSGSVSGSFYFGSGSVYGSSSTDTNEVNHCNKCGNQWKKHELKYKDQREFLGEWMDNIYTSFEKNDYIFPQKTIDLLKEFHAESIYKIFKNVEYKCYLSTRDNLTLSKLRTKFKSIYDK